MNKGQTDDLFKGYSEYATALQVDPVKYQRGITAIGQMMGKGQIMAEELKGQLAEGIPGSLQVFVKAAQEAFNDTTIDVEKLMDKMQAGELKAAKILPYVSKYFAEAARKGGALDKALNSNRVAMQQMQQSWINFQNALFEGGFGEQMTRVFRDLATILNSNGELAQNLGGFFGNVIEGFWDMVTEVHDDFVFLDRIFEYYAAKLGVKGDMLKEVFNWGAYLLGMGAFIKGISSVLSILTKIAGLRAAIVAISTAMGGMGKGIPGAPNPTGGPTPTPEGTTTPTPGGAAKGGGLLSKFSKLGFLGKLGILGELKTVYDGADAQFLRRGDDTLAAYGVTPEKAASLGMGTTMPKPVGLMDVWDSWFNTPRDLDNPSPTLNPLSLSGGIPGPRGTQFTAPPPTKVDGQITIKVEAGELRNMVRAVVDENNMFNLNMLMQGGSSD